MKQYVDLNLTGHTLSDFLLTSSTALTAAGKMRYNGGKYYGYTTAEVAFLTKDDESSLSVKSATQLTTSRKLWGNSFNGSQDISGDITLGSGKKIYFGSTSYYIELVGGNLHTNIGFYSDKFISARGKDDSGSSGGGGADLESVWESLTGTVAPYASSVINVAHIPDLAISKITGLQSDLDTLSSGISTINGKIPSAASSANQLADKAFVNTALGGKLDYKRWACTIKCATWSRLCYIACGRSVIGSSFLINVMGTRNSVVYNDTFAIKAHHPTNGSIVKISGGNYSSGIQIRTVADSSGNCYVELYDAVRSATSSTTQTVYCSIIPIYIGTPTLYTAFTDGTTLPANFGVAKSLTTTTNNLQGNLSWDEITGKPSSMPASDVYAWAKAATKPSYTKAEVGLGNVDNTADANKSVAYATSAGTCTGNAVTATKASSISTEAGTSNENRPVFFGFSGDWTKVVYDADFQYNPATNTIKLGSGTLTPTNYSGNAATATKLATARTISLSGAMSASASFNGESNANLNVSSIDGSFISWADAAATCGTATPLDYACSPTIGGNRAALCNPAGITVESSIDGGTTWSDYGLTDAQKVNLLCDSGTVYLSPKHTSVDTAANAQLRVTLNGASMGVYTKLARCCIYGARMDASNLRVLVEWKASGTWSTQGTYTLSGWPAWNSFPASGRAFGGAVTALRLTFKVDAVSSSYPGGYYINKIFLLGQEGYTTPSTLAATGHLYSYNSSGDASFPAKVSGTQLVSKTYNSSSYFLMGDGSVATKKNLTSATHSGWSNTTTDAGLIPTMNTIAFWNGAFDSSGNSNLAYLDNFVYLRGATSFLRFNNKHTGFDIESTALHFSILTHNASNVYQSTRFQIPYSGAIKAGSSVEISGDLAVSSNVNVTNQTRSKTFSINGGCTLEYDSTNKCVKFVF